MLNIITYFASITNYIFEKLIKVLFFIDLLEIGKHLQTILRRKGIQDAGLFRIHVGIE